MLYQTLKAAVLVAWLCLGSGGALVLAAPAFYPGGSERAAHDGVAVFFCGFWVGLTALIGLSFHRLSPARPHLRVWRFIASIHAFITLTIILSFWYILTHFK